VDCVLSLLRVQVQSLVRKIPAAMSHGKKKKKESNLAKYQMVFLNKDYSFLFE
jgi:hypothetical protein